jgi:hypothetical protein
VSVRPRHNFAPQMFFFQRYDPGSGAKYKLVFEAHIVSINDTSSPAWSEYFDMGRPHPKLMYQSVNRSINVNFMIVAVNEKEYEDNMDRMGKLGRMTYPLIGGSGYNGPHVRYQIGNLMGGFGVITNLDYSWDDNTPWIKSQPIYTNVDIGIKILADAQGTKPKADGAYYFWGFEKGTTNDPIPTLTPKPFEPVTSQNPTPPPPPLNPNKPSNPPVA